MLRCILLSVSSMSVLAISAQQTLTPSPNAVEKKWIHNDQYQMTWYALKDTAKFEIGSITTTVQKEEEKLTVITSVAMKQAKSPWTDSTIALTKNLAPVYHSSYNGQRDMALHFGNIVTGFYNNKIKGLTTMINDTVSSLYFDSNIYPVLIGWLPLQEGYTKEIAIYDYNPAGKTGVLKATITNVKKTVYESQLSGSRPVWAVSVSDELGGGGNGSSVYYIDMANRQLWKQEISVNGRTMLMQRVEK